MVNQYSEYLVIADHNLTSLAEACKVYEFSGITGHSRLTLLAAFSSSAESSDAARNDASTASAH